VWLVRTNDRCALTSAAPREAMTCGVGPLTPCRNARGYLESLRLTVCSTTCPQVDWLSPRGDA